MNTVIQCPGCRTNLRVRPEKVGRLLGCPRCKKSFRLGERGPALVAAPGPAQARARPAGPSPRPLAERSGGVPAQARARPLGPSLPPSAGGGSRRPPDDDKNETVLGRAVPPPAPVVPPPLGEEDPVAPPAGRAGVLRWALVGSLLTFLLVVGGLGAYHLWTSRSSASVTPNPGADPVVGKWGAVEIGSKGIKVLLIDVFADEKGGYDFSEVWTSKANDNLVKAAADGQAFDPKVLGDAVDHVQQFCTTMRDQHGLPPERLTVVCSSGVFVPFKNDAEAIAKNRAALTERVKAATGCTVAFNSVTDEARLGMNACVPRKDRDKAVFLDVGSGNTKGGYFESGDVFQPMGVELGSVTYTEKVKAEAKRSGKPFAEQAAELRPALLEGPLRNQVESKPGLGTQPQVHLVGGAVWALATFTHPNDSRVRIELSAADVDRYAALVRKSKAEVRSEVLAQVKDPEQWKKVDDEVTNVQKTFDPENLQAGAEILLALSKEYNFKDKQLYFFRKGHLAWPLSFVWEKKIKK